MLTINIVARSQVKHETNKSKFLYVIDCTAPMIFKWAEAMNMNIKCQLSKAMSGNLKQFGFRSVFVTFFLE